MLDEQLAVEEEKLSPVVVVTTVILIGLFALGFAYRVLLFLL